MGTSVFVIGTDHRIQPGEVGFEAMLDAFVKKRWILPLRYIAEEYAPNLGETAAQRIAKESDLNWYNLDLSHDERIAVGILEEQQRRPACKDNVAYRVPSDDVRENAWVEKVLDSGRGCTTIAICGFCHFESFVQKLEARGCTLGLRVYLEYPLQIKLATGEEASTE
jgi:hypothetical protein